MADVAEFRLHPRALAIEHRLRIGGRAMRRVRALRALEVDIGIAAAPAAARRIIVSAAVLLNDFKLAQAAMSVPSALKCLLIRRQADEPAEQEVELQPLHQLALGADRIERLQEHRPQEHLRRRRRAARLRRIERIELRTHLGQRVVHDRFDRPQRMIGADSTLDIDIGEQLSRASIRSAHAQSPTVSYVNESPRSGSRERLFQQPARGGGSPLHLVC